MNIMGTGWDVEASARGTMPFICSCIFFQFSRFSPAIVSAKINFLSRTPRRECSFECELWNREALAFVKSERELKQIMQTTLNRCCQSQRRVFEFQSMWKSINLMQQQATRREFAMRRNIFGFVSSQLALEWSFHEFLIRKFFRNGYTSV